jgi:hypothetical protein
LADVGAVQDMADHAISILGDEETHQRFKKNAMERAKVFDLSAVLPRYEELYIRTLEKAKATVL